MLPRKVRCPQCGTYIEYRPENPFRPFCSDRCKLIDLGAWAEERYAITGNTSLGGAAGGNEPDASDDAGRSDPPRLDS